MPDEGRIGVWGASPDDDLSMLPKDRTLIAQRLRGPHDALSRAGWDVVPVARGRFAASVVMVPRARDEARATLADAVAATDGPVAVDGPKTHGIEAVWKAARADAGAGEALSKAHGKLFVVPPGADLSGWAAGPSRTADGWLTAPGLFSADGVDPASAALADALPKTLGARGADLGAGWGFLTRAVLDRDGVDAVEAVEADARALDCLAVNVPDPRVEAHWADATVWRPEAPLDFVVTNPPFHGAGRTADPALGRAFIATAAAALRPKGTLWLVANRHLPYEAALAAAFAEADEIGGTSAFKILRGHRPRRPKGG